MSDTISTAITQGITLSANPTTITGTGSVTAATGVAITGPADGSTPITGWTLSNEGSVSATAATANGIDLAGGGSITNAGVIAGYNNGVDVGSGFAMLTNTGTIDSSPTKIVSGAPNNVYDGVYLADGGSVTNSGTGTIFGGTGGIDIAGASGTVTNTGSILTTTLQGNGVALENGGTVTNSGSGSLYGDFSGVSIYGGIGLVTNSATIGAIGLNSYGIYLGAGGTVTNTAGGSVIGSYGGIATGVAAATISNAGYVYGATTAINAGAGGIVTNMAGAEILSLTTAVSMNGGTVINAGTIDASSTGGVAVSLAGGVAERLVVEAGATFVGAVTGGGAGSVLELGAEPTGTTGTLAGIGGQITAFDSITFDSGDTWSVAGTIAAFNGDIVAGFTTGDSIVLDGVTGLSSSFDAQTGTLSLVNGATTDTISFSGTLQGSLTATVSGANTMITLVPCFAAGTRIATPQGEQPVEALQPGDTVVTVLGEVLPIIWIGQRQINCDSYPHPDRVHPVLIQAHAFAEGAPHRDLLLSPDHAILADGVLIPAKQLVNGTTIRQIAIGRVTYHHIELTRHAVILSEGLPTESFLDTGDRSSLGIGRGDRSPQAPAGPQGPEAQLIRDALACAPIRIVGPEVDRVRGRLDMRAARTPAFA